MNNLPLENAINKNVDKKSKQEVIHVENTLKDHD